ELQRPPRLRRRPARLPRRHALGRMGRHHRTHAPGAVGHRPPRLPEQPLPLLTTGAPGLRPRAEAGTADPKGQPHVKFPVDDAPLSTWSTLLGLTPEQTAATLTDIETTLRIGYTSRPLVLRDRSFEELTDDMDVDEFALLFLISGLRQAGHPDA